MAGMLRYYASCPLDVVTAHGLDISGTQARFSYSQVVVNSVKADIYCKVSSYFRTVASTNMNDVSSRSHAIFTILFTQVGKQTCVTITS